MFTQADLLYPRAALLLLRLTYPSTKENHNDQR
jgi:hypothetical protein